MVPPTAPGLYNGFTVGPEPPAASTMWPPRDRRASEPAKTEPVQVVIRDSAVRLVSTGLLAVITWAVVFLARTVPLKLQEYDMRWKGQDQMNDRVIGVLERHEKRDDKMEERLTRLERDR